MIDRDNEYFLCAVEERSLARAALRLGVSQSALTRAVQRLEARHGLKLLERAPRGVEPTAAGELLARSLREMAARAETTARQLRDLSGGRRGEVRVGVGQTIARRVREALLPRLLQDRPGATLQLDTGLNYALVPALEDGRYDFVVSTLTVGAGEALACTVLLRDELVPVVRAGHPLARAVRVTPADVFACPLIGSGPDTAFWRRMRETAAALGERLPPLTVSTNDYEIIVVAVQASEGVGFVPRSHAATTPGLVALAVPGLAFPRTVGLIRRRDADLSPTARRAAELIEGAFAQPPAR